jgi:peptidoglycan hydrolase-like protein with peptidoglycan-binding domain
MTDRETLREGDNNEDALHASQLLHQLGYYADYPDPYFGTYHVQAVQAFQEAQGLTADGVLGPTTWDALEAAAAGGGSAAEPEAEPSLDDQSYPTLREGDSTQWAQYASELLQKLGHYTDAPDPYYGTYHVQAVEAFQAAQGLTADGVLGPHTWDSLRAAAE